MKEMSPQTIIVLSAVVNAMVAEVKGTGSVALMQEVTCKND